MVINGAYERNRTGDLFLTKEVLYLLSYVGTNALFQVPLRPYEEVPRRHFAIRKSRKNITAPLPLSTKKIDKLPRHDRPDLDPPQSSRKVGFMGRAGKVGNNAWAGESTELR